MKMLLSDFNAHYQPGRPVKGMSAMLLPFSLNGEIAEDAFVSCLLDTVEAGLQPAVNMDTGYVYLLSDREKERVLKITKQTLGNRPFVAGAYIEGQDGNAPDLYRREIARISDYGGIPILFQTSRLHNKSASEIAKAYALATVDVPIAYAFELGRMFAPNGEIWTDDIAEGIMSIPQIKGMKHSSLNRVTELKRLSLRDRIRPDFSILTGNDLGINMIEYGSDYLLGLAAFSPAKFAERDQLWLSQDASYLEIADALQFLGNSAFRPPVPAYKHSAAIFLNLTGKIPTPFTHPHSPVRPAWECEIMKSCAQRLGLL
jgi:4-hydroxy-tetrahydrodipicolinate synthase